MSIKEFVSGVNYIGTFFTNILAIIGFFTLSVKFIKEVRKNGGVYIRRYIGGYRNNNRDNVEVGEKND